MSGTKLDRGLPSRHVTEGLNTALNRIYFHAMGLSQEDLERPIVGVASAWDGASASGSMPLRGATKAQGGVWAAGGMPRQFATIADDVAEESLVGRELIADSVELTVRGHSYDGLLGVTSSVAGMAGLMMVMCRLDVPAALVPLVGPAVESGADALALAAVAHELGLAAPLPVPLPDGLEPLLGPAHAAGAAVMAALDAGRTARSGVDAGSLGRAAAALVARGGNPDLMLHLLAIASECGVEADPVGLVAAMDAAAVSVRWCGGDLAPAGALLTVDAELRPVESAARVFEDPDAALEFASADWPEGTAIVVRGQGPVGGPGLTRLDRLCDGLAALPKPADATLITDGRLRPVPGLLGFSCVGPEAALDGPLAALRDGDPVAFSPDESALSAAPSGPATAPSPPRRSARLEKYAAVVGPAAGGAVTHPGARAESVRYAEL